ncbi:hypothetical protein P0O24_07150 [Methanotrichaceae archaeon M04Ac]|uniref:Uncharacterized protein n=1 Tax=Candidatus Methanocrinis alkalitolerans TaxID=3033395 RepID=A0ABT5XF58_9EURY|nr:hypothetical protein [Candidatus Methanocrinis alkalitolerans]MCR3884030.1 hypothetical protein [Methanothrix sp.]MDF0593356.1 hypothetical protein [Candidatus Methanocrinis alkalitolerans]
MMREEERILGEGRKTKGRKEERRRDPRGMTTVEELAERYLVGYDGWF